MRFKNSNEQLWAKYTGTLNEEFDEYSSMAEPGAEEIVMSFDAPDEVEVDSSPSLGMETSDSELDIAIYTDIKKLAEYSKRILEICKETKFEPWMLAQLVKASDYVSDVWHQLDAEVDFANTGFEQADDFGL